MIVVATVVAFGVVVWTVVEVVSDGVVTDAGVGATVA